MAAEKPLEDLACVLAKNYFDSSQTHFAAAFGGELKEEDAKKLRETGRQVFADPDAARLAVQPPERTVLIVGAGASVGAFGNSYPGPMMALDKLHDALKNPQPDRQGDGAAVPDGAEEAYRSQQTAGQFERALAALVKAYGEARVRDVIRRQYGQRYRPHLAFEIIAHLFRHRFIDVIINFNFDELLDEAIEGEMGTAEYRHVFFDAECTGLAPLIVDRRLKIPLYVKPHGTVSYPSSLRLVAEPPFRLSEPMHRLVADIIGGHWTAERTDVYEPYRVNLVTLGFSMKSSHLLDVLHHTSTEKGNGGITIYHINRADGLKALREEAKEREWSRVKEKFIDVDDDPDPQRRGLAEVIRKLWIATQARFTPPFRPRGVARHEIVHNLFFAGGRGGAAGQRVPTSGDRDYFLARLYAETAMAIARGNGQIDLGTMADSRVGATFDLLRNCRSGRLISMYDILKPFAQGEKVEFSGLDNSVFRFRYADAADADQLNWNMAHALWDCLLQALSGISDPLFENHLNDLRSRAGRAEKMVGRFYRLARSDAQDISPSFRHRHWLLSHHQRAKDVIHTSLGLSLRFVDMLSQQWDVMLAISENGKVMDKYQRHLEFHTINHTADEKRFCLILAGNAHPEISARRLQPFYGRMLGLSDPPLFYLPEWAHNQHMVLLLKREGTEYRPVSAVRYETLRLGNRVSPVFIDRDSREDLEAALESFKRYLRMSVAEYVPGTVRRDPDHDRELRGLSPQDLWLRLVSGEQMRHPDATPSPRPNPPPHRVRFTSP